MMGEDDVAGEIGYRLSAAALAYIARKPARIRDPRRTCSRGELERLLRQHGLPESAAVFDFESNLGGWCSTHPPDIHGLGVYLSLQEGPGRSPVADEFRTKVRLYSGQRDRPDSDGGCLPLWGTGYPRAFFLDRPLTPAGMAGEDVIYFPGEQGEVYMLLTVLDELYLLAGSGRTLLEFFALTHPKQDSWFEVHVCADVSSLLAGVLDIPRYEPASDQFFQWWVHDTAQLRLVPDHAPCISGTHLACKNEADLLRAMRCIRDQLGVRRVRIWQHANIIADSKGRHALAINEVEVEIVRGAGPGGYQWECDEEREGEYVKQPSQYQSTLCDPESWT